MITNDKPEEMTLTDWFAGQALNALMRSFAIQRESDCDKAVALAHYAARKMMQRRVDPLSVDFDKDRFDRQGDRVQNVGL